MIFTNTHIKMGYAEGQGSWEVVNSEGPKFSKLGSWQT